MTETSKPKPTTLLELLGAMQAREKEDDEFWENFNDELDDLREQTEEKIDAYKYIEDEYYADAELLAKRASIFLEKAKTQRKRADRVRDKLQASMAFYGIDRAPGKIYSASTFKRKNPIPTFTRLYPEGSDLVHYPDCVKVKFTWKNDPDFMVANKLSELDLDLIEKHYLWDQDIVKAKLKNAAENGIKEPISEIAEIKESVVFKWDIKKKG